MANERDFRDLIKATRAFARSPRDEIDRELRKARSKLEFETECEMAERHVREGGERVQRQRDIVLRLREKKLDSELAETLLGLLEDLLAEQRYHLERLRSAEAEAQPAASHEPSD